MRGYSSSVFPSFRSMILTCDIKGKFQFRWRELPWIRLIRVIFGGKLVDTYLNENKMIGYPVWLPTCNLSMTCRGQTVCSSEKSIPYSWSARQFLPTCTFSLLIQIGTRRWSPLLPRFIYCYLLRTRRGIFFKWKFNSSVTRPSTRVF